MKVEVLSNPSKSWYVLKVNGKEECRGTYISTETWLHLLNCGEKLDIVEIELSDEDLINGRY